MKKIVLLFSCLLGCLSNLAVADTTEYNRIVALSPSAAEMLEAAGVQQKLIAIPDANYQTTQLSTTSKMNAATGQLDATALSQYHADVVVGNAEFIQNPLVKVKNFYDIPYGTLAQIPEQIQSLGKKFGNQAVADQHAAALQATLAKYDTKVPFIVIIENKNKSYYVAGQSTFVSEAWERVGGKNVVTEKGWVKLSKENLQQLQPRLIVDGTAGMISKKDFPNAKVVSVNPDIFFRYSPRIIAEGLPQAQKIMNGVK